MSSLVVYLTKKERVIICVSTMFCLWVIDPGSLNLWIFFQFYRPKSYHKSVTYHIQTGWARLFTCAVSVGPPFWDAAAVLEDLMWDHRCDDETPPARTANSLNCYAGTETTVHLGGCNSRQAHYAALTLFTCNLDRARGTKATGLYNYFFHWASRPKCGAMAAMKHQHLAFSLQWERGQSAFIYIKWLLYSYQCWPFPALIGSDRNMTPRRTWPFSPSFWGSSIDMHWSWGH